MIRSGAGLCLMLVCAIAFAGARPSVDAAIGADPEIDAVHPAAMVEFSVLSQGQQLPAHIYIASGAGPHPTVVMLHGLPGNERNLDIAQALRRFGFNAVFFHYRGAWGAQGEYSVLGQLDDTEAVMSYLRQPDTAAAMRVDGQALSLLGHSLGAFTALAVGARNDALRCVMALSPVNLALFRDAIGVPGSELPDLAAYADTLFMLRGLNAARFRSELDAAPVSALDTRLFGPGLAGKAVFLGAGEDDRVTPAAQMYTPLLQAYGRVADLQLGAALLPGDHSFSTSRLALTRALLSWAGDHCR